jgi:NUMOD3 motif
MSGNLVYGLMRPYDMSRPAYIGMGGEKRPFFHARSAKKNGHRNHLLQAVFEKAWRLGFDDLPIVVFARGLSWDEAIALEQATIARYGRVNNGTGCLTNLTAGGEGVVGAVRSPETCARISAAKKGKKLSEEAKRKMSAVRTGRKHSDETKKKMSIAQKGRTFTDEQRRKMSESHRRRPPPSAEARKAAADARRGLKMSPRLAEILRAVHLGAKRSDETRAKISAARRRTFALRRSAATLEISGV